jgi:serine/threonine protein kinase
VQKTTSNTGDGLPYRWMSPEAIQRRRWSEKSDVWAFAVTVWEMFTHGQVPYFVIPSDSEVAKQVVEDSLRLQRPTAPTECPVGLYSVLQQCFHHSADSRPGFVLVKQLVLRELTDLARKAECCICLGSNLLNDLLALVPCGHRCVCSEHAHLLVGNPCPVCRQVAREAIRVFDST